MKKQTESERRLATNKELASKVIAHAKKMGAETASVSLASATAFQVEARNERIESLKESKSSGIHVLLGKEHRRSSFSSNDLRLESILPMMQSTLDALPYMEADPFYTLPDPELQGRADLELRFEDFDFDQYSSQTKIEKIFQLERKTLALDPRLQTEQVYYSDMKSHGVYADSNGFLEGQTKTLYCAGISIFAEDPPHLSSEETPSSALNTARKQTDGWYSTSRFYNTLEPLQSVAERASHRVLRKLGAVKPSTQKVPVVFSPEMARSFLSSVASAMMGSNIFRKRSFLYNRLDEKIANDQINLKDQPLLPGGMGSRYFDSEGVRASPLVLIEDGVLRNYMLSTYSSNKLSKTTTGHASGISNLILTPGTLTEKELIASVDNGLYLTSMSGQGSNITTGDYSRGGQGIWIRDGLLAEPVSEFTLASTFMDMLNDIVMIASEVDPRESILSPSFKIKEISISGS